RVKLEPTPTTTVAVTITTATVAITLTTTAITTTAVATTITAATIAAALTTTKATAATLFTGTGFIDGQVTVLKTVAIKAFDRFLGCFNGCHLDETEALRATCLAISDECYALNFAGLFKQVTNLGFGSTIWQIANVQLFIHGNHFLDTKNFG